MSRTASTPLACLFEASVSQSQPTLAGPWPADLTDLLTCFRARAYLQLHTPRL